MVMNKSSHTVSTEIGIYWMAFSDLEKYSISNFQFQLGPIHKPPASIRFAYIKHALAVTPLKYPQAGGLGIELGCNFRTNILNDCLPTDFFGIAGVSGNMLSKYF